MTSTRAIFAILMALPSLVTAAGRISPKEPPVFSMTLAEAEAATLQHSLELKAAADESAAASDQADAQFGALLPRLTVDGLYHYQTEIPTIQLSPALPPFQFEPHRMTSIGPTLNWTLWDEGALYKSWRAQKAAAKSQSEIENLASRQATLSARLAYIQVQLAREQVMLLSQSAGLAIAQYDDIRKRWLAGTASRIDALSSHHEELQRRKDFLQAQATLAGALRELFRLSGQGKSLDVTRPVDSRIYTSLPSGFRPATVLVTLDDLNRIPPPLAAIEGAHPDAEHPAPMAYQNQAESARLAAQGISRSQWPVIQFQGLISYEYPNGPILEYVTQKAVGLTASMPIFEGGQISSRKAQQLHLAKASEDRRDLAAEQIARDWDKATAAAASLHDQEELDDKSVAESEELARLVYSSYKAGRSNYIEVETYNLNALQAKVQAAQTRAQILIQLATLAEMAPPAP